MWAGSQGPESHILRGAFLETRGPAHGCGRAPLKGCREEGIAAEDKERSPGHWGVSRCLVTVTGGR